MPVNVDISLGGPVNNISWGKYSLWRCKVLIMGSVQQCNAVDTYKRHC